VAQILKFLISHDLSPSIVIFYHKGKNFRLRIGHLEVDKCLRF